MAKVVQQWRNLVKRRTGLASFGQHWPNSALISPNLSCLAEVGRNFAVGQPWPILVEFGQCLQNPDQRVGNLFGQSRPILAEEWLWTMWDVHGRFRKLVIVTQVDTQPISVRAC